MDLIEFEINLLKPGKHYMVTPGDFVPEMQKRALENKKVAPENCHRLQCKNLFNVADLVNWDVDSSPP